VEIRATNYASTYDARLAQADHGEAHGRKVAKLADGFHAGFQVLNFRHGKRRVFAIEAARTLADVDQPIFATIDQWFEKHSPNQSENGSIGANTERQREDDRN